MTRTIKKKEASQFAPGLTARRIAAEALVKPRFINA
tara:strand:- start:145 stop:252 length:108 start_codon:yes stop_codon:yes gene_type:complete